MNAIVVDGQLQSALAVVRSLGSRGVAVDVGASTPFAMAQRSRFCRSRFRYPDPMRDPDGFVAAVARRAGDSRPVVYFFSDATALALSRRRDVLDGRCRVVLPDQGAVERAFDKRTTLELARELGIDAPRTYFADTPEALDALVGGLSFPAVVKPRHSCVWVEGGSAAGTAEFCRDVAEVRSTAARIFREAGEMPLVQEAIRGEECGFFGLWRDGEPLATFAHRRLRSIRATGGASVLREAIRPDPRVEQGSLDLMRALRWTGVAMVEFKFDERTGSPCLMEINGRFWGSLPLAVAAGVDFPWLCHQLATTGRVDPPAPYRVGTRSRQVLADARNLAAQVLERPLHTGARRRARAVREFLRFREEGLHYDVAAWDDPVPFFVQVLEKLERAAVVARRARRP